MANADDDGDHPTPDSDDRTRTAHEPAGASLPQPPSQRLAAPLQYRDRDRYVQRGEHGRGGLGVVNRVHDKELGRDVAIKELLSRGDLGEIRFLREALITARLEHPGIVPIHEAGRWPDGTPFYVMKLVAGRSLKELLAERPSVKERLELLHHVIAVADAVAYAHKRRIIHRDLKTSNVIAGDYGETVVIDWGLAKDLSDADLATPDDAPFRAAPGEDLTEVGRVLGTPDYMAPEQQRGEPVDQRADVYAIGVMLWQLCSLDRVPPAEPRQRARALRRAGIDRDLATIIQKALAPLPADRYQDAGELAEDLRAFKSGARIAARHYSLLGLLAHWTRRHRALAVTVSAALVIALAGTAVFVANIAAERDRADAARAHSEVQQQRAEAEQQRAEAANNELVLQNAALLMLRDPTAALRALGAYRGTDTNRLEMLRAEAIGRGVAQAEHTPHRDTIWFLAGDADGTIYSLGEDRHIYATQNGDSKPIATDVSTSVFYAYAAEKRWLAYARTRSGITVLDLRTRQPVVRLDSAPPTALAISPDGSRLAALHGDDELSVWSLPAGDRMPPQKVSAGVELVFADPSTLVVREKTGLRTITLDLPSSTPAVASRAIAVRTFHARGPDVAIGDSAGHLTLLSRDLTPSAPRIQVCHKPVNSVRIADRANIVAFVCLDGTAGLAEYDGAQGKLAVLDTVSTSAKSFEVALDESGSRMVVTTDTNTLYVYDRESRLLKRYEGHPGRVTTAAAPHRDFDRILSSDITGTIRVWQVPERLARTLVRAPEAVYGAAISPDGALAVTDGTDTIVRRIELRTARVTPLRGHQDIVLRTRYAPDGQTFLSLSLDRTVRAWGPEGDHPLRVFPDHAGIVGDAEYIEGGARIASVGDDSRLLIWSPRGRDVEVRFSHGRPLSALEVIGHNNHIVVHDTAGGVWDVSPKRVARPIRTADHDPVTMLRASPDGKLLAIGLGSGLVSVYETAEYRLLRQSTLTSSVRQIQLDPRGRDLLITDEQGRVQLMALGPRRRAPWQELAVGARDVAYSWDGEQLAIGCADGATWLYSFGEQRWIYVRDHAASVSATRFSPDRRHLLSTDRSGAVVLRDLSRTFSKDRR